MTDIEEQVDTLVKRIDERKIPRGSFIRDVAKAALGLGTVATLGAGAAVVGTKIIEETQDTESESSTNEVDRTFRALMETTSEDINTVQLLLGDFANALSGSYALPENIEDVQLYIGPMRKNNEYVEVSLEGAARIGSHPNLAGEVRQTFVTDDNEVYLKLIHKPVPYDEQISPIEMSDASIAHSRSVRFVHLAGSPSLKKETRDLFQIDSTMSVPANSGELSYKSSRENKYDNTRTGNPKVTVYAFARKEKGGDHGRDYYFYEDKSEPEIYGSYDVDPKTVFEEVNSKYGNSP